MTSEHSIMIHHVTADPLHFQGAYLVVEQAETLFYKHDAQFLGSLKDRSVILASCGGSNVFCARAACSEHVVDEREL
jgi:hypothetical protein